MIVALIVACAVVVALSTLLYGQRPEQIIRGHVHRRCLVTMKDGQAFSGILWQADRTLIVLRDANLGGSVPVDGEVLLHRADVAYVQVP